MATSTVEGHPSRAAIERDLRAGIAIATVARGYGLSRSAVTRYRNRVLQPRAATVENPGPDDIIKQLRSLYTAATQAVIKARDSGNAASQISAQREARTTLALVARLMEKFDAAKKALGASPEDGTAPPPEAIQSCLIAALEPHPKARAAVVTALTKLEQEWRPAEKTDD